MNTFGGMLYSQGYDDGPSVMLKREFSFYGMAHSRGLGLGFRWGTNKTALNKNMIEVEFLNMKHPKEIRTSNNAYFESARSFVYGKENYVMLLRGGLASQHIINEKPYWGGVEVRRYFAFGASIGMAKPSYLYVIGQTNSPYEYFLSLEQYNPETHDLNNIYGRGPFFKGFGQMKFYPGLYSKMGLSFEYGSDKSIVKALEVGVAADAYLSKIPILAFCKNEQFFITFYLTMHMGRRFNPGHK